MLYEIHCINVHKNNKTGTIYNPENKNSFLILNNNIKNNKTTDASRALVCKLARTSELMVASGHDRARSDIR